MPTHSRETPIERICRQVMGRKIPLPIKSILLCKSGPSYPNVLDYPGTMSQWEKESLVAEARLFETQLDMDGNLVVPERGEVVIRSRRQPMESGSRDDDAIPRKYVIDA